jgi:glycosyltransferase involved in cell wall biosynthesis
MRAGLPITTTDVGGNSESVRDDREGLIVNAADADGLADAIRRMLDDPSLRVRLGNAARKRFISEFTDEAMLHKTAAWLKAIF